jgi:branched-chain amino acid transport system ATP-binding protein
VARALRSASRSTADAVRGPHLGLENVSFSFGGVSVLNSLSLRLEAGSVVGLVGPNGAGKTTLMNVISGVLRPASGQVVLGGSKVTRLSPDRRARLGLARTYQIVRPLRNLSVLENVMVGALYGRAQRRSIRQARRRSEELLDRVGLSERKHVLATSVSSGQQKLMDVARALAMEPDVLIMDEPLAALTAENQQIVVRVASEAAESGCAVLLVEHLIAAILGVAARLVVLDRGVVIADGEPSTVVQEAHVVDAYLGTAGRTVQAAGES